ncbi:MAG TPA: restriction endonuclease subunit S [Candidatus Coprovivens excrementavium]|nr:restriction endonuclease subunit S [Candidatus Coprovivens excrementavium]
MFKNISSKGFQNLPVLSVTQDKGVIYRDSLDIDIKYDSSTLKNYKLVQPGDFIISLRSFQGGFETSYLTGITSPAYTIFNFIDNQSQNHMFWQYLFKRKNFINSLKKVTFGIRDGKAISFSQFGDVKVEYPDFDEQKHIAITLNKIDDTIQLHEDYLQLLYDFRSFLLQKMFSINDTFPNLRFKQFNDKWKYKKLGEVADIVSGGTPDTTKHDYWNGSINWYTPAEVGNKIFVSDSQRKITNIGLENSSAKILPVGTVLFTSRAGIGKTAILKEKGSTNQGFQSIVPKQKFLDSYFIFSISNILKKYGESHGAGSTFLEISGKELAKAKISLPSITEQKNISKVLFKLDTIITLQKQKIDNLKKLKQFLLQNMFI